MEYAITVVIVAAAAGYVVWRWVRSTRRALRPGPTGTCGGDCEGCTVPLDLRRSQPEARPLVCDEIPSPDPDPDPDPDSDPDPDPDPDPDSDPDPDPDPDPDSDPDPDRE